MRIVVVDDNPLILNIIEAALNAEPAVDVLCYGTGAEGVAACDSATDLAIFDLHLPDFSGIEALARLRARPETKHLPVIIVTADTDRKTRLSAINAGATDFLEKPLKLDELRMRAQNFLALRIAQKQVEEREALLEMLVARSGIRVAVADARLADTPMLFVSEFLATADRRSGSCIGDSPQRLWQDAPPAPEVTALATALARRIGGHFVIARLPARAEPVWTEVTVTPVPRDGAEARWLVVVERDVTDLISMRSAHDRLEARLAEIARVSGAWFFETDARQRITYISGALAESLGSSVEEMIGTPLESLKVQRVGRRDGLAVTASLFDAPHARIDNEIVAFTRPDGATREVLVNAAPFVDEQGAFAGYRGHVSDVSEIARARDQAAQASRAKSVFLALMSHEMRTPLTGILGMAEVMSAEDPTPSRRHQLGQIAKAAEGLEQMLSDVLDVADMELERLTLTLAPFEPVARLRHGLSALASAAAAKGLSFDCEAEPETADCRLGDGARVVQIVRSLVSNAVKFTETGAIRVRIEARDPERLVVTVSDTGIGMTQAEMRDAFTPFAQADDGMARRFSGAGLGLSLARGFSEAMGGRLEIDSTPGSGTDVRVLLPLPRVMANESERLSASGASLAGCRVLVADDTLTNRLILKSILERAGADVTLCQDGPEALAEARAAQFDMLLLDINMPGMAGTEVLRRIRAQEVRSGAPPVPALAVTANARPDQVAEYLAIGFSGCVAKPFTGASLLATILHHSRASAA